MIYPGVFDFFFIDGSHEGSYLKREIQIVDKLLKIGGLLILDDINPYWNSVQEVYKTIDNTKYAKLGTDGSVGILKKIS